jgi:hypothetical protein
MRNVLAGDGCRVVRVNGGSADTGGVGVEQARVRSNKALHLTARFARRR